MARAWNGWRVALAAGVLTACAPPALAQMQAAVGTPRTPLTYAEAEARLRTTSSLGRAAGYGVEAAEAQAGEAFNLKQYHDAMLAQGAPPVRFARQLMLDEPIE